MTNEESLSQGKKLYRVIFRSSLPRITNQNQEITSTRNLTPNSVYHKVPTYSRILNQFPIDLDFVETSSFYTDPSTWLIASNLKLVVGCKDLQYTCIEGNTWLQNSQAHKNTVASKYVYRFSNWVSVSCDGLNIKLL